ncbi:MAG: hypothetical protein KAI64_05165, partial [Thermoplasmata archaeon]|nr:hypothetical protein [Thermoplasmata archaeon]
MKGMFAGMIALILFFGALAFPMSEKSAPHDDFLTEDNLEDSQENSQEDSQTSKASYTLLRYDERRSGQAPIVGDLTDPKVLWTYERPPGVLTSPIVADIDDDGRNEIVFGG